MLKMSLFFHKFNHKQLCSAVLSTNSLGSVIIWKEKHLGTAETVEVSDTDSIKCNGNVFQGYQMIKPGEKAFPGFF